MQHVIHATLIATGGDYDKHKHSQVVLCYDYHNHINPNLCTCFNSYALSSLLSQPTLYSNSQWHWELLLATSVIALLIHATLAEQAVQSEDTESVLHA
jgi:hypothetical protein